MTQLQNRIRAAFFILLALVPIRVYAGVENLDPDFDSDGLLYDAIDGGALERVETIASLANPDGSSVLLGRASPKGSDGITTYTRVMLKKIQANGSVDVSFGEAGQASQSAGSTNHVASVVKSSAYPLGFLRQSDGKYVVFGYVNQLGTSGLQRDVFVMRFGASGSIDTTFGQQGVVIKQFSDSNTDYASAVSELPDGSLLVGGMQSGTSGYLMRLHSDGSTDTNFGTAGVVAYGRLDSGAGTLYEPIVSTIMPLANGQFLVAGTHNLTGDPHRMRVSRFNADGSLDSGFGSGGHFVDVLPSSYTSSYGRSLLVDSQGRLVVMGYRDVDAFTEKNFDLLLVRLTADGALDTTFDGDGKLVMSLGAGNDYMLQVSEDAGGRLVVIGNNNHDGYGNLGAETRVARFLQDGALDTTFDADGKLQSSAVTHGLSVLVQEGGKLLLVGSYYDASGTGNYEMAALRLTDSGADDVTFGIAGLARVDSHVHYAQARMLLQQSDGKWLVIGFHCSELTFAGACSQLDAAMVRYLEDGSRDAGFAEAGVAILNGGFRSVESMIIQSDGKPVVVGNTPSQFRVMRLNVDGTPDAGFSGDGLVSIAVGMDTGLTVTAPVVLQQADGKLVVAGQVCTAVDGSSRCIAYGLKAIRLLADGSLDTAFDGDGIAVMPGSATVHALARRADGSLLLFTSEGIRAVNDNGSDAGLWSGEAARYFARMPDGRWLVLTGNAVKRLDASGSVDVSFGAAGSVAFDPTAEADTPVRLVPLAGGRFLVAGYSCIERNGGWCVKNAFAMTAHGKHGETDTGYLPAGKFTTAIGAADNYLTAAALQQDGNLMTAFSRVSNATLAAPEQEATLLLARFGNDDADSDGVVDALDAFPADPLQSIDTDIDGITDTLDDDDDGDGVPDFVDGEPLDFDNNREIQWSLDSQYHGSSIQGQVQAH